MKVLAFYNTLYTEAASSHFEKKTKAEKLNAG